MHRRDLIKLSAGAALVARAAAPHRFFTEEEYKVVDELTEMIIPADEKSGGAKAARCADYIDMRLAEAFEQVERDQWRAGLKPFVNAPAGQLPELLKQIAINEKEPFFVALKNSTVRAYYTSKIGIHDDLDYQGNVYQSGEYSGELP
jgi:gluconate 2-dehydrogenase gamma chain